MPEPTSPAEPQAGGAGDTSPQAGTITSPDPQAGDGNNEPITLDEAKKLRSEARSLRQRLSLAETQAKEYADFKAKQESDKLTETERWQKQATELQSKYESDTTALTERIVRYEVERQAAKLGIIDPDAAAQLIDWEAIEYDANGTPTNADSLLKDLLKAKPYLGGRQSGTTMGGATNPSRTQTGSMGQITLDTLQDAMANYDKLSPAQQRQVQNLLIGGR